MVATIFGNRGINTAAANTLNNIYTASNISRMKGIGLYNLGASLMYAKVYINTYVYIKVPLMPSRGEFLNIAPFVGTSEVIAVSDTLGSSNLHWHLAVVQDVNANGPPNLTGGVGYYTSSGAWQTIWTPPASQQHRMPEISLFNGHSAPIVVRLGNSGHYVFEELLQPDEGIVAEDLDYYINANQNMQIYSDAPTTTLMYRFTGIENVNG